MEYRQVKENPDYVVYENGLVRRADRLHFCTMQFTDDGYARVQLNSVKTYVHRIVANAFLENPNNYPTVNHKDFNKLNNHWRNLEWCTQAYNNDYTILHRNEYDEEKRPSVARPVKQIDPLTMETLNVFPSLSAAAIAVGRKPSNVSTISKAARGVATNGVAYGFIWKFLTDEEREEYKMTKNRCTLPPEYKDYYKGQKKK